MVRGILLVGILWACTSTDPCKKCDDSEICVDHLLVDDSSDHGTCVSLPEACPDAADCADNACVLALYDMCDAGFIGSMCDDEATSESPTVICYEEE